MSGHSLFDAFLLLWIGMISVFTILLLIVLAGKTLIWTINRYVPSFTEIAWEDKSGIQDDVIAVITAAVNQLTEQTGKIEHIIEIKNDKKPG
ncbi:MAG TPA: OadG family protein [Saprospiraceae bacterium]|nr:OadG family protein [Saprospiraceae bacterium]